MGVVGTYGVTVAGIAFLMRCCKILSPVLGRTRLAFALSDNAFSVTRHHALGFFLATSLFAIFAHVEPGVIDFDYPSYLSSYSYRWMPLAVPHFSFVCVCGQSLSPSEFTGDGRMRKGDGRNDGFLAHKERRA